MVTSHNRRSYHRPVPIARPFRFRRWSSRAALNRVKTTASSGRKGVAPPHRTLEDAEGRMEISTTASHILATPESKVDYESNRTESLILWAGALPDWRHDGTT